MPTTLFDRALHVLAGALVVALLATVSAGVLFRAANHPLSWSDEGAGFLMVWLSCAGWMIATRRGSHIRIRFFQDMLPMTGWRWTEVAFQLAMALFGGVIAWTSVELVRTNSDIEAIALPVSNAWMYAPMLPAGLLTAWQALGELLRLLRGGGPPPGEFPAGTEPAGEPDDFGRTRTTGPVTR